MNVYDTYVATLRSSFGDPLTESGTTHTCISIKKLRFLFLICIVPSREGSLGERKMCREYKQNSS